MSLSRLCQISLKPTAAKRFYGGFKLASRTLTQKTRFSSSYARGFFHRAWHVPKTSTSKVGLLIGTATVLASSLLFSSIVSASQPAETLQANWEQIRQEIIEILDDDDYDDGSYGPIFIRLAWHASGTYNKSNGLGGSNGATMRFSPESLHSANAGLHHARERLEMIKARHPEITYADLWTFAAVVAVKELGGPEVRWRPGRVDFTDASKSQDGLLPDASKGQDHVRDIFYRMGFNDREIVALIGAHAMGRCHSDRSGYSGPWTRSPTFFSNDYFEQLLNIDWKPKKWDGPLQYEDATGELMMLPGDLALRDDPEFRKYVEMYAKDEPLFFEDFAAAFAKLLELGVPFQ